MSKNRDKVMFIRGSIWVSEDEADTIENIILDALKDYDFTGIVSPNYDDINFVTTDNKNENE